METPTRLRSEQLRKYMAVTGIKTADELARRMGISPSIVSRVFAGKTTPNLTFAMKLLEVFPQLELSDLFEVVDDDALAGAA